LKREKTNGSISERRKVAAEPKGSTKPHEEFVKRGEALSNPFRWTWEKGFVDQGKKGGRGERPNLEKEKEEKGLCIF